MKLVFFGTETDRIASIRYRVIKFADMLAAEGHDCRVCLPGSTARWKRFYENRGVVPKLLYLVLVLVTRIAQLRHVPGAKMVFFRGPVFPYGPPIFERIIRSMNKRMVFDIDDAVWAPPAYVDSPFVRFLDHDWIWKVARMSAHGVVGNEYLREQLAPRQPNLTIIPTCVNMERHTQKDYPDRGDGPVVLGWTGLHTNLGYFEIIAGVLQRLAQEHRIVLSVATGKDYHLDGVEVINRGWTLEHEIDYLQEADVGLMPLLDSPRARGKCAYKAVQYMAVGTPCVISPVGMNATVIDHGVTGYLAATDEDWYAHRKTRSEDAARRERMGGAARERVAAEFSHDANFPKFRSMVETVASLR